MALVLVVGALVAFLLVRRGRARHAWDERLTTARDEIGWFVRDLVPQLRGARSADEAAGGWNVASPRIAALEDQVGSLVTTAPGDEQRARATALRDAIRASRARLTTAVGQQDPGWRSALDEVEARLLAALVPPDTAPSEPLVTE